MLLSRTRPCRQHAQQNSSRTESVKGLLLLDSSNMDESVGKVLVSTRFSASVMQNSAVEGGYMCLLKFSIRRGNLFMRNDRRR